MKIELQAGDTITIPEGCKAVIKDGSVVFEKEQEFKDGDIVISDIGTICIFKENSTYDRFTSYYNTVHSNNENWSKRAFHYASEEEKQLFFNKLKAQGLKWNAEKKKVEKVRWRAKNNEEYYSVGTTIEPISIFEYNDYIDYKRWNALNYFKTKEQAKEASKRVKETLRKYHEEIGE